MKEPLDDAFLRRSKRFSREHGFRSDELALEASNNPSVYAAHARDANVVAPHLPIDSIQANATGYLKIQPEAASAAYLSLMLMTNKSCNRDSFFWPCGLLHFCVGTLSCVLMLDLGPLFLGWMLLVDPPNILFSMGCLKLI